MPLNREEFNSILRKICEYPIVLSYFRHEHALKRVEKEKAEHHELDYETIIRKLINIIMKEADMDFAERGYLSDDYKDLSITKQKGLKKGLSLTQVQAEWFGETQYLMMEKYGIAYELTAPTTVLFDTEELQFMDELLARHALLLKTTATDPSILTSKNRRSQLQKISSKIISSLDTKLRSKILNVVLELHESLFSERGLHSLIKKIENLPEIVIEGEPEKTGELKEKRSELIELCKQSLSLEEKFTQLLNLYDKYQFLINRFLIGRSYTLLAARPSPALALPAAGAGIRQSSVLTVSLFSDPVCPAQTHDDLAASPLTVGPASPTGI